MDRATFAKRLISLLAGFAVLCGGPASAAPLLPVEPPALDLVPLLPLAGPPLDKPPVSFPELAVPDPPEGLPQLPPAPLVVDLSQRPLAPLPPPRILACNPLGTLLRVASELLECGRARLQRDEREEARTALEEAARVAAERALAG